MRRNTLRTFLQHKFSSVSTYQIILYISILYSFFTFCIMPFTYYLPRAGHDIAFHISRIAALADQLSQGIFYSKINYWYGDGIGYAASLGYPDIFLYIPALLVISGIDIKSSYQIFLISCSILTFCSTYLSYRCFALSKHAAAIGSLIYCIAPYHIYCTLIRSSLGEIQAFIFLPLIIAGTYNCIHKNAEQGYFLCLGFTGIVLSHVISSVLAIILFLSYVCTQIRYIHLQNIKWICTQIVLAMLLTAFFWMPLLEFYFTNDLCIHHALHTTDIFAGSITSLFIPSLQADKLFFGLTIFIPAFYILYKYNKSRTSIYLFCVGTLLAVITTDIFPFWKNTAFSVIQFPWRLYGIATLCISLSFAFLSEKFFSAKQYDKICYSIGIIILSANIIVLYACIVRPQYYHAVSKTEFGGGSEFLPHSSRQRSITREDILAYVKTKKPIDSSKEHFADFSYNPATDKIAYMQKGNKTIITVSDRHFIEKIHTRLLCYSGYKAYASDDNGSSFSPTIIQSQQDGFCDVIVNRDFQGKILVQYESSLIQKLSYIVTSATLIFLILSLIYSAYNKIVHSTHRQ